MNSATLYVMSSRPPRIDWYNALDGRRLALRVWNTAQEPRARVVFVHGITSHGGWYASSCSHLADAGFEVHFLDRRGSGLNTENAGDVERWETWVDDVSAYIHPFRDRPTILCGISWGGKLAVAVARRNPNLVQGLSLICPGLYSPHEPGIAKRLFLAPPAPPRLQQRRVRIPLRKASLFTDSPVWQSYIDHDALSLRTISWRFAREDRALTRFARDSASYLHMPLLLMLAGRDRIVDNRRTVGFYQRTSGAKRTVIEYPNAAHTLEFEADTEDYFSDLSEWMGHVTHAC